VELTSVLIALFSLCFKIAAVLEITKLTLPCKLMQTVAMSHVYIASVLVFLVVLLNAQMASYPEENIT